MTNGEIIDLLEDIAELARHSETREIIALCETEARELKEKRTKQYRYQRKCLVQSKIIM